MIQFLLAHPITEIVYDVVMVGSMFGLIILAAKRLRGDNQMKKYR